jgi:hypothetical protein
VDDVDNQWMVGSDTYYLIEEAIQRLRNGSNGALYDTGLDGTSSPVGRRQHGLLSGQAVAETWSRMTDPSWCQSNGLTAEGTNAVPEDEAAEGEQKAFMPRVSRRGDRGAVIGGSPGKRALSRCLKHLVSRIAGWAVPCQVMAYNTYLSVPGYRWAA